MNKIKMYWDPVRPSLRVPVIVMGLVAILGGIYKLYLGNFSNGMLSILIGLCVFHTGFSRSNLKEQPKYTAGQILLALTVTILFICLVLVFG